MNEIKLIGNLGKDPESKETKNGVEVSRFTVATNDRFKDGEEWKDRTTWHNVTAYGKLAVRCNEHLKKGQPVFISGKQVNGSYENEEGKTVYYSQVVAKEVNKVDYLRNPESTHAPEPPVGVDDDLPF